MRPLGSQACAPMFWWCVALPFSYVWEPKSRIELGSLEALSPRTDPSMTSSLQQPRLPRFPGRGTSLLPLFLQRRPSSLVPGTHGRVWKVSGLTGLPFHGEDRQYKQIIDNSVQEVISSMEQNSLFPQEQSQPRSCEKTAISLEPSLYQA